MMQSMPTGIVYSMQPEEGIMDPANPSCEPRTCMQDEDCESGEVCFDGACLLNPKVGSGFLTSSTRLATAHHVVWPNKEPEYVVRFGGNGDPYPDTGGGTFIGDAPPESWDQSLFPVFTNEVENFLVANRLMQIGLDEWVDPANPVAPEVREKLRAWRFVIGGDGVDVPLDFQHQRFVSLAALPARIEGQDVAFLRAHELFAPLNEGELPRSGGFPFSNPGMFFDALRASSISAASSSELDDTTPLVALHSPEYPTSGTERYAQVISRSGSRHGMVGGGATAFCLDGNVTSFNKTHEISTDLDIAASSSGGAMLGCPSAAGQIVDPEPDLNSDPEPDRDRTRGACAFTIDGNPAPDQAHIGAPIAQGVVSGIGAPLGELQRQLDWGPGVDSAV